MARIVLVSFARSASKRTFSTTATAHAAVGALSTFGGATERACSILNCTASSRSALHGGASRPQRCARPRCCDRVPHACDLSAMRGGGCPLAVRLASAWWLSSDPSKPLKPPLAHPRSDDVDEVDEVARLNMERSKTANQAMDGELKREYERLLEEQRLHKQQEDEENERKLRAFIESDPEIRQHGLGADADGGASTSGGGGGSSSGGGGMGGARSALVANHGTSTELTVALLRQAEEALQRRRAQEARDEAFARQLAEQLEREAKQLAKAAAARSDIKTRKRSYETSTVGDRGDSRRNNHGSSGGGGRSSSNNNNSSSSNINNSGQHFLAGQDDSSGHERAIATGASSDRGISKSASLARASRAAPPGSIRHDDGRNGWRGVVAPEDSIADTLARKKLRRQQESELLARRRLNGVGGSGGGAAPQHSSSKNSNHKPQQQKPLQAFPTRPRPSPPQHQHVGASSTGFGCTQASDNDCVVDRIDLSAPASSQDSAQATPGDGDSGSGGGGASVNPSGAAGRAGGAVMDGGGGSRAFSRLLPDQVVRVCKASPRNTLFSFVVRSSQSQSPRS